LRRFARQRRASSGLWSRDVDVEHVTKRRSYAVGKLYAPPSLFMQAGSFRIQIDSLTCLVFRCPSLSKILAPDQFTTWFSFATWDRSDADECLQTSNCESFAKMLRLNVCKPIRLHNTFSAFWNGRHLLSFHRTCGSQHSRSEASLLQNLGRNAAAAVRDESSWRW